MTVDEAIEKLKFWRSKGKGHLHTNHIVIVEEEAEKRAKNEPDAEGKQKTKICWDADDPEVYALFHVQRERYMKLAKSNKTLATEAIIMALRIQPDEEIQKFLAVLEMCEAGKNPNVPRAVLPATPFPPMEGQ